MLGQVIQLESFDMIFGIDMFHRSKMEIRHDPFTSRLFVITRNVWISLSALTVFVVQTDMMFLTICAV